MNSNKRQPQSQKGPGSFTNLLQLVGSYCTEKWSLKIQWNIQPYLLKMILRRISVQMKNNAQVKKLFPNCQL